MTAFLEFPLQIKKQFAAPLDVDSKVETLTDLETLKNSKNVYEGMLCYCVETSTLYIYNKLGKFEPLSNKQDIISDDLETTDKTIVGAINEVNGNSLDTVGFSADYKNIILNKKNGLNPYTIPISAIIHNASLAELKDVDSTDIGNGKTLVYDGATNKHKYVDSSTTDELVKMDSTTDAKYLSDLIDKSTVVNENGILKVKRLDGQDVTIAEINHLKGLTMNVMDLVNSFANGGVKVLNTPLNTASELDTMDRTSFIDGISYIVYVLADENHSGAKTTYLCTKTSTTFFGNADNQRNFITNPIDLANEVTGKLGTSNIDVDNLWTLLTINDTYKTLTTNNEIFGTHGAKAMYDELLTEIGAKANATDLTTHTNNTDIHVTTTDKAKWDKVIDKVNTTDFNSLKTTVDGKIDKTNILTTLDDTVTNEQVASALLTKTELDKTNAKLGEKADKTELDGSKKLYITNTGTNIKLVKIASAPTNGTSIDIHFKSARTNTTFEEETVRISKYVSRTIYDGKIIQKGLYAATGNKPNENEANFLVTLDDYSVWAHIASYSTAEIELYSYGRKQSIDGTEATTLPSEVKYSMFNGAELATMDKVPESVANPAELDANKFNKNGYYSIGDARSRTNLPVQQVGTLLVFCAGNYVIQEYILNENQRTFIRRSTDEGNGWSAWKELATMDTAKDVGVTTITPVNSAITGTIEYTVNKGICYVSLFNVKSTTNDDGLSISTTMPKPAINSSSGIVKQGSSGNVGFVYINKNTTQLKANIYLADIIGSCNFSYPVAES